MMILCTHNGFLLCRDQTDSKRNGKNQSVDSACQYQKGRRISKEKHDQSRNCNKSNDDPVFIFSKRRMEGFQEGYRVYAAPTIEVTAAHKSTRPAKRYPICPAPCRNASAAGLSGSRVAPLTTTPRTARNRNTLTIVAIPIPITELLLISFRFSSPVIPASIRR